MREEVLGVRGGPQFPPPVGENLKGVKWIPRASEAVTREREGGGPRASPPAKEQRCALVER